MKLKIFLAGIVVISYLALLSLPKLIGSETKRVENTDYKTNIQEHVPQVLAAEIQKLPEPTWTLLVTPTPTILSTSTIWLPTSTPLPKPTFTPTLSPMKVPTPTHLVTPLPIKAVVIPQVGCDHYVNEINAAADKYGIRRKLLYAMLDHESQCNPLADSGAGDSGIAQIHLAAHPDVTLAQAQDPNFAIDWAGKKLSYYLKKYNDETWSLRYYNCGENFDVVKYPNCGVSYASEILNKAQ